VSDIFLFKGWYQFFVVSLWLQKIKWQNNAFKKRVMILP